MGAEIARQELQDIVAELLGALVAQHRRGEADLAGLQPILPLAGDRGTADQEADDRRQDQTEQTRENAADQGRAVGGGHFGEAPLAQIRLFLVHRSQLGADEIHFDLATVGHDHGERLVETLGPAQRDGLRQLRKFGIDMDLQRPDPVLLLGIVAGQLGQPAELRLHRQQGGIIGLEIALVIGQQEAALPRLRVLHGGEQLVEGRDDLVGMDDLLIVLPQGADIGIGDRAAQQEETENGRQAGRYKRVHARFACRSGKRGLLIHSGNSRRRWSSGVSSPGTIRDSNRFGKS